MRLDIAEELPPSVEAQLIQKHVNVLGAAGANQRLPHVVGAVGIPHRFLKSVTV